MSVHLAKRCDGRWSRRCRCGQCAMAGTFLWTKKFPRCQKNFFCVTEKFFFFFFPARKKKFFFTLRLLRKKKIKTFLSRQVETKMFFRKKFCCSAGKKNFYRFVWKKSCALFFTRTENPKKTVKGYYSTLSYCFFGFFCNNF